MARTCSDDSLPCPVSRAIEVLQEKWVLNIVHTLLRGPRGFNELGRDVGGCNPTTLTQRLARLEAIGLVHRSSCGEGNRSVYALTEAGEALRDVIDAIYAWSVAHLDHAETVDLPRVEVRLPEKYTVGRAKERPGHDVPHPPAAS
ncbi:MAG: helix-turn-helix domain-containing protein [Trueperaceae bacterium]|nr:helix-turn-helix domain-containing protein [Trueperaceae bacterium]